MSLPLILFLLLFVSLSLHARSGSDSNSTAFRRTLSDDVQEKLSHCNSFQKGPRKLLCELLGALDAQANDDRDEASISKSNVPPPQRKCRFESEGGHQFHRYASPASPQLQTVMDRYMAMHSRCTALEFDNITNIFNSGAVPRCRYMIWGVEWYGLGNRLLSLTSAFIYAILSQRVLLIDYPEWSSLFCDPLQGHSPTLISPKRPLKRNLGVPYVRFRDAGCGFQKRNKEPKYCDTTILNLMMSQSSPINENEFHVCPSGVSRARNVPFISIKEANQYFAVGFFLNPALAPVLDVLFPERNPFHVLSKYLFSPSDQVWDRVRHYLGSTLSPANRRIGVQLREFSNGYTEAFDLNIPLCIGRKAGFVPAGLRKTKKMHTDDYLSVYVATLAQGHIPKLNRTLALLGNQTGKIFKVASQQVTQEENHDASHQQEALVDMWVLSLSDVLLTSKMSTFGYVAQGLGGLVPYFIQYFEDQMCQTGIGTDPCYHYARNEVVCDVEKVSARELLNQSQSVKHCPDFKGGWQLARPF